MPEKTLKEASFSIEHGSLVRDLKYMIEGMPPEALGKLAQSLYGAEFTPYGDDLAAEYGFRVTTLWPDDDGSRGAFESAKRNFEASNSIVHGNAVYLREADLRAFTVQDLQAMSEEWDSYLAIVVSNHFHVRVDTGYTAHSGSLFRVAPNPKNLMRVDSTHFAEAAKVFELYASEDENPEFTVRHASRWPDPPLDECLVLDRAGMIAALANQVEGEMPPEEVRDFAAELFNVKALMSVIPGSGVFVFRLESRPGAAEGDEFDAMAEKMAEAGLLVPLEDLARQKVTAAINFS